MPALPTPTLPYPLRRAGLVAAICTTVAAGSWALWLTLGDTAHQLATLGLPLVAIVAARTLDITIGVLRTVFVVTGRRALAGLAATTEAGVWLAAAGFVLDDLSPARGIAFAVGVGLGTISGMWIVRAAALGLVTVRVFVDADDGDITADWIRDRGFAATVFYGDGRDGPRAMILCFARRREARTLVDALAARPRTFVALDSDPAPGFRVHGVTRV